MQVEKSWGVSYLQGAVRERRQAESSLTNWAQPHSARARQAATARHPMGVLGKSKAIVWQIQRKVRSRARNKHTYRVAQAQNEPQSTV